MRTFEIVDLATVQRADGDEVQRRIVSLENLFEPRRAILNHEFSVEAAVSAAEEEFSCPRNCLYRTLMRMPPNGVEAAVPAAEGEFFFIARDTRASTPNQQVE